jgi:hypothetical protein
MLDSRHSLPSNWVVGGGNDDANGNAGIMTVTSLNKGLFLIGILAFFAFSGTAHPDQ